MAIVTLTANETGANSLTDINANFADLDTTKADLASPTFTGTPSLPTGTTAVTQSAGDNSTKIATTAYVENVIGDVSCRVYAGGATTLSSGAVIAFDTEAFDTHGFHDTVTNNSRLTIPSGKAGKYLIGGSVNCSNTSAGALKILLNGATDIAWGHMGGYSGVVNGGAISTIYNLAEGNYVELWGQQSHSAEAGTGTTFWLTKIS